MKVALLGDARFIGRASAQLAIEAGHEVTLFHTGKYAATVPGASYKIAPRLDLATLRRELGALQPDALIDTFAMTRDDARNAAEALSALVPRVVVLSSHDVYGQFGHLLGHPLAAIEDQITEDSPLTAAYPFRGIAKHAGGEDYDKKQVEQEFERHSSAFDALTILRLPATYGTGDNKYRFAWIVDRLDAGESEIPYCEGASWRWTHHHIADTAAAVLAACSVEATGFGVFNIGEARTPTMRERVEQIAQRMNVDLRWRAVSPTDLPADLNYLGPMPCDVVVDSSAARAMWNLQDCSLSRRIDDMVGWLRLTRAARLGGDD